MKVDKSKWRTLQLNDIGKIISGATPRTDNPANWEGGNLNWVTPAELNGSKYYRETIKKITSEAALHSNVTLMPAGTVLLSSRAPIGKVSITTVPMYCNQGFKNIVCDETIIYNEYLYYYLIFSNAELNRRGSGATFKEISKKVVESFPVLLPTLEEQKGVAAELDRIQEMIDGYKAQIADLDALAQSIFLDIIEKSDFPETKLKETCTKMMTGPFGSMLHQSDYVDNGVPLVNPQDIKNGYISYDDIKFTTEEKALELNKYSLETNDIIIARRGDLSKCAIYNDNGHLLCGTGSFVIHLKEILPIFFYYWFKSDQTQHLLAENCIGSTMPNLNQRLLQNLEIPLPPLALQELFAMRVKAIEALKGKIHEQIADCELLMAERMQYYFS